MNIHSLKDEFSWSELIVYTLIQVIIICWNRFFKLLATAILRFQLVLLLVHSTGVLDAYSNFLE